MTTAPYELAKRRPEHQVDGWRDRYCAICGAGPAVHLFRHYVTVHGASYRELGLSLEQVASDDYRAGKVALFHDHKSEALANLKRDPDRDRRRRRRWADMVEDEASRGPGWMARLASRWRISSGTASHRVHRLVEDGYLAPPAVPAHRSPDPCGTYGAYLRHRQRGEAPCDACQEANLAARRRRYRQRRQEAGHSIRGEPLVPCGTPGARHRHQKAGEPPCEACREAHAADQRQRAARRREEDPGYREARNAAERRRRAERRQVSA